MAYAALVSLAQTLDQVLIGHSFVVHDHEKQQIQSLHEKIVFLSTFLEDFPREATKLEARIRVAANQVQDILDFPNESSMLQEHIYKYLKGRRFLIVVDDIWSGNTWDDLRTVFPDDFNGSQIIITTRDADVASHVDSLFHPYEMHLMGVDSSWNLLRQKCLKKNDAHLNSKELEGRLLKSAEDFPLQLL